MGVILSKMPDATRTGVTQGATAVMDEMAPCVAITLILKEVLVQIQAVWSQKVPQISVP
ncbi:hypothetical protein [Acidovorax sp.]|uniref:hypothetical protein n=1 Tax=Acidovorax sp. TaxID=1872122 RepID=UPI00391F07D9